MIGLIQQLFLVHHQEPQRKEVLLKKLPQKKLKKKSYNRIGLQVQIKLEKKVTKSLKFM